MSLRAGGVDPERAQGVLRAHRRAPSLDPPALARDRLRLVQPLPLYLFLSLSLHLSLSLPLSTSPSLPVSLSLSLILSVLWEWGVLRPHRCGEYCAHIAEHPLDPSALGHPRLCHVHPPPLFRSLSLATSTSPSRSVSISLPLLCACCGSGEYCDCIDVGSTVPTSVQRILEYHKT